MEFLTTHGTNARTRTAWERMSREDQIIELAAGMTRHAWKAVQQASSAENTGAYCGDPRC